MDRDNLNDRLSRISTMWTMIFQAHAGPGNAAARAQEELMRRYSGAVYRYLLGALHDPDVAADLCQEFALRFVRGDFRRADPERGRFRSYLKTALSRLVTDHHRARQAWPRPLPAGPAEPAAPTPESADADHLFLKSWREELLERTWKALAEENAAFHATLLCRIEHPDLSSAELADLLFQRQDKPLTAAGVRKTLQRAHARYADLLLNEVVVSLEQPSPEALRQELEDLDLLRYCRSALERRPGADG
jgi:RNA polymerase sigma-70 factor (ECF subfamily)